MTLGTYLTVKASSIVTTLINTISDNWLLTALLSIWAFFEPISAMLYFIIFGVGIDFISGIFKAWKLKQKITSWRLRDTILKLFLYLAIVMLIYGIQITCFWGIPISNIVAGFILFAEALSIAENIDVISNNKLGLGTLIRKLRNKWFKEKIK
jgi:phage-related holin